MTVTVGRHVPHRYLLSATIYEYDSYDKLREVHVAVNNRFIEQISPSCRNILWILFIYRIFRKTYSNMTKNRNFVARFDVLTALFLTTKVVLGNRVVGDRPDTTPPSSKIIQSKETAILLGLFNVSK